LYQDNKTTFSGNFTNPNEENTPEVANKYVVDRDKDNSKTQSLYNNKSHCEILSFLFHDETIKYIKPNSEKKATSGTGSLAGDCLNETASR